MGVEMGLRMRMRCDKGLLCTSAAPVDGAKGATRPEREHPALEEAPTAQPGQKIVSQKAARRRGLGETEQCPGERSGISEEQWSRARGDSAQRQSVPESGAVAEKIGRTRRRRVTWREEFIARVV